MYAWTVGGHSFVEVAEFHCAQFGLRAFAQPRWHLFHLCLQFSITFSLVPTSSVLEALPSSLCPCTVVILELFQDQHCILILNAENKVGDSHQSYFDFK